MWPKKQQVTIATPLSPKDLKDETRKFQHSTPMDFRFKLDSDEDSLEDFYSPEGSPQQKVGFQNISTEAQGAVPKNWS